MISFEQAMAMVRKSAPLQDMEQVTTADALGRVLAAPVVAAIASPRSCVSTMDGYAVRHHDVASGRYRLAVVGTAYPGAPSSAAIHAGEAVRIFTGALMPDGADRVIIQEQAARDGDVVLLSPGNDPAQYIRTAASDFGAGDVVLPAGLRLSPGALLAAAGADAGMLTVAHQPRIALLATGDELVPAGSAAAQAHAIPDSVSGAIAASVYGWGGTVARRCVAPDRLEIIERHVATLLPEADVLVLTGGASVGERDFAKAALAAHGIEMLFSTVAIKPGKPVWFGRVGNTMVLGLPGNPTSASVTARLFLAPLIAAMQGQTQPDPLRWRVLPLAHAMPATGGRDTFVRARWDDAGLTPLANQDSGAQAALAQADWLIHCRAGEPAMAQGTYARAVAL